MNSTLHVPMRMCAVTREKLPKKELLRFVYSTELKKLVLDKGERVRGRGVNLKPDISVFDEAIKRKVFERTFEAQFDKIEIEKLKSEVEEYIDKNFRIKQVVRISKENLDNIKRG
jgi:predicted RNA-binding protein YlxR (DUF448 family)